MKFEETFDFDYPAEVMLRMFTDQDYFLDKYERLGGRKPELVDSQKTDDRFSITVRHALDANKLSFPDIIKKRVGDRIMLRQTDVWNVASQSGRIDIDIEKAPVKFMARSSTALVSLHAPPTPSAAAYRDGPRPGSLC